MGKFYSKNYWSVGFQSKLYDRLSPESYFESMRRVVAFLPEGKSFTLLDAGCGSGLLLRFLAAHVVYTGTDLLKSGVDRTLLRAQELGGSDRVSCFQSDLSSPLPVDGQKFDVVVGHFSLYTLASSELRQLALKNLRAVMKAEGILILANPSVDYDADAIIEQSIRLVRERQGVLASLIKQYLVYPFTKAVGLRFIQNQLTSGKWQAYTREGLSQEMEEAGFSVQHIEDVYAGSAFLGVARRASTG